MKTPDEIKKGLACTGQYSSYYCSICPYNNDGRACLDNGREAKSDALEYIQQLEANWNQVSKALCGKENATLEEVLQAVDQVKRDAEWEDCNYAGGKWYCSNCAGVAYLSIKTPYCPHCGAKMDGGKDK